MLICEYRFNHPDPENPDYSMLEIDYYSWIPTVMYSETPNHRLTLRKNLVTEKYELVRKYRTETKLEMFFTTPRLDEVLKFGDNEWNHFHGIWSETEHKDTVCDHAEHREFCGKEDYDIHDSLEKDRPY